MRDGEKDKKANHLSADDKGERGRERKDHFIALLISSRRMSGVIVSGLGREPRRGTETGPQGQSRDQVRREQRAARCTPVPLTSRSERAEYGKSIPCMCGATVYVHHTRQGSTISRMLCGLRAVNENFSHLSKFPESWFSEH